MTTTVIEEEVTTVTVPPARPKAIKVKKTKKVKKAKGLKRITRPIKRAARNIEQSVTKTGKKAKKSSKKVAKKTANVAKAAVDATVVTSKRVGRVVVSASRTAGNYIVAGARAARGYIIAGARLGWHYLKVGGNTALRGIGYIGNFVTSTAAFIGNTVGAGVAVIGAGIGSAIIGAGMLISSISTYIVWGIVGAFFVWLASRRRGSLKKTVKSRVGKQQKVQETTTTIREYQNPDADELVDINDAADDNFHDPLPSDDLIEWVTAFIDAGRPSDWDWGLYPQNRELLAAFNFLSNDPEGNQGHFVGRWTALENYLQDPTEWDPKDQRPLSLKLQQFKGQQSQISQRSIRDGYKAQVALIESALVS
jgi:hypothetical protein